MKYIHLNYFYFDNKKIYLKLPLKLEITPLGDHDSKLLGNRYWIVDDEIGHEFDIVVWAPTKKLLKQEVYGHMSFIYQEFALEQDSKLTPNARNLKKYILENTYIEGEK